MADHTTRATADFGSLLTALQEAAKAWAKNAKEIKALDSLSKQLARTNGDLVTSMDKVSTAKKRTIQSMDDMSKATRKAIDDSKKLRAEQQKAAAEQQKAAMLRSRYSRVQQYVSGPGHTTTNDVDLQNKYNEAMQRATAEAKKQGLTLKEWKSHWDYVNKNGIDPYNHKLSQLQVNIARVQKLDRAIAGQKAGTVAATDFGTKVQPLFGALPKDEKAFRDLSTALSTVQAQIVKTGRSSREVSDVWNLMAQGKAVPQWASGIAGSMGKILTITEKVGHEWRVNDQTQQAYLHKLTPAERLMKLMSEHSGKTMISWSNILRIVGSHLMYTGISKMAGAFTASLGQAVEIQRKIAEIQTIDVSKIGFEAWAKQLRALSDESGIPIINQTEAAYQTLSNQIASGADAARFLGEANKFAVAAVTDASTAVNLATAKLNAYGESGVLAEQSFAEFFKTIELGRVRASEMQNTYGRVAIAAAQLGVEHHDLAAAIATLSIQGVNYNETATQLRGIMVALLKPTSEMRNFLISIGVSTGEAAIAAYGFGGVIKKMGEYTQGSSTEMAKLIPRIRGISGAFAFSGRGMDVYEDNLNRIRDATTSYNDAFTTVMENSGKKLEIEMNKIRNYIKMGFGQETVDALAALTASFVDADTAIKILGTSLKGLGLAAAYLLFIKMGLGINAMVLSISGTGGLVAALTVLGPPLAMIAALAVTTGKAFTDLKNYIDGNKKAVNELAAEWTKSWSDASVNTVRYIQIMTNEYEQAVKSISKQIAKAKAKQLELFGRQSTANIDALRRSIDLLETDHNAALKTMLQGVRNWEAAVASAENAVDSLKNRMRSIQTGLHSKIFDWGLEDMPIDKQINMITAKIANIQRESDAIIRKGNLTKDDVANFEFLRSELDRYFAQRRSLYRQAMDQEKEAEEKSAQIRKKRLEAERELRMGLRDLEWERIKLGKDADPEAVFELTRRRNDLILQNKRKLKELKEEEKSIVRVHVKRMNNEKEYKDILNEELRILKAQTAEQQKKIAANKLDDGRLKQRVDYELLVTQMRELVQFKPETLTGIDDPKKLAEAVGEITTKITEAQKGYRDLSGGGTYGMLTDLEAKVKKVGEDRKRAIWEEAQARERARIDETASSERANIEKIATELAGAITANVTAFNTLAAQVESNKNGILGRAIMPTQRPSLAEVNRNPFAAGRVQAIRAKEEQNYQEAMRHMRVLAPVWGELREELKTSPGSKKAEDLALQVRGLATAVMNLIPATTKEGISLRAQFKTMADAMDPNNPDSQIKMQQFMQSIIMNESNRPKPGAKSITKATNEQISQMERLTKAYKESADALDALPQQLHMSSVTVPPGMAYGGILGSDTVPTMLAPGEFVVNRHAAKANFAQLVSMNSGMANGGGVSVGDIHVNLTSSGNANYDAVQIANSIRTEIRRGRFKW